MGAYRVKGLIIGLSCLAQAMNAYAGVQPTIPLYEASYAVQWNGMKVGVSTHRLEHLANDKYRLVTETEPSIPFVPYEYNETSEFTWQEDKLIPQAFIYNNKEGMSNDRGRLTFDWQAHSVSNNKEGKAAWSSELLEGAQDKLTHTLQLRQDILQDKEPLTYRVMHDGKVRNHKFEIIGSETIETKIGPIDSLIIENKRRNRKTVMWLSKADEYLLVQMKQYRKEKLVGSGHILSYEPVIPN